MIQTHFRKQGSHWLAEAVSQFTRLAPNLKGMASVEVLVLTKLSKLTKICRKIRSQVKGIPCNSFRDWAPPEIANETARGRNGPHGSPKCPRNPISGAIAPTFGPFSCLEVHKCPRKGPQPPQPDDRDAQTQATSLSSSPRAQSPPRHKPPNEPESITGGWTHVT